MNHDGTPPRAIDDFFASAPPEIGEVLSASASATQDGLLKHERRVRLDHRIVFSALFGVFFGAFVGLFGWLGAMTVLGYDYDAHPAPMLLRSPWPSMVPGFLLVFVCTYQALRWLRPAVVTFVGADGLARVKRRPTSVRVELIKFVDVDHLTSLGKQLRGDHRLEQPGLFSLGWVGKSKFVIHGTWERGKTPEDHPVHFARAALKAWNDWNERRGYSVLSSDRK